MPVKPTTPDYYIVAQQFYQSVGDELQAFANYLKIFDILGFAKQDVKRCLAIYQEDGLAGVNLWLALEKQEQLDIGQYLPPLSTAYYLIAADEPEQALAFLALASEAEQVDLLWAKSDPRFAQLHDDPRFIEIMKKAGFLYLEED